MTMISLLVLGLVALAALALIFGAITLWVWLGASANRTGASDAARLAKLEAEVAELRELVVDAVLERDDCRATRLGSERSDSTDVDA